MSIHQAEVDVFGVASYPATAQVIVPFQPREILIVNMDTSDDVFVSLDGTTDHAHLLGGDSVKFTQTVKKIFLKRGAVGTTPTNVQVISEG